MKNIKSFNLFESKKLTTHNLESHTVSVVDQNGKCVATFASIADATIFKDAAKKNNLDYEIDSDNTNLNNYGVIYTIGYWKTPNNEPRSITYDFIPLYKVRGLHNANIVMNNLSSRLPNTEMAIIPKSVVDSELSKRIKKEV